MVIFGAFEMWETCSSGLGAGGLWDRSGAKHEMSWIKRQCPLIGMEMHDWCVEHKYVKVHVLYTLLWDFIPEKKHWSTVSRTALKWYG